MRPGQEVKAKLIEQIEPNHWIVSFHGKLLQVKNDTKQEFKPGQILNLEVRKTNPLELQIKKQTSSSHRSLNRFA